MKSSVLERPVHQHGTFVLPAIASDVPTTIGTLAGAERLLASFALAAEKAGFPLPGGEFTSVESTVKLQLQAWLDEMVKPIAGQLIVGSPTIEVSDHSITFAMEARSNLGLYRLKPVFEALEAKVEGLGWYVYNVISSSPGHGMNIYGPSLMGYQAGGFLEGAESDEEFVTELFLMENSESPLPEDIPALIEQARESYAYLPSDVLANVENHRQLLGWSTEGKGPRQLDFKRVKAILKTSNLPRRLRQCVEDAVELDRLYRADKERAFCWDGSDDAEPIGAVCFLAWDDADLLIDMVEHYEQDQYNNGCGMECLARITVMADAPQEEIKQLARHVRAYFERWNGLAKVLGHFVSSKGTK